MRIPFISSKHFRNFSLANKIAVLSLLATVLGLVIAIYLGRLTYLSVPPQVTKLSQNLQGIWYMEYTYPTTSGTTTVRGTSEYFTNGSSNFVGQLQSTAAIGLNKIAITYDIDGSNDWQASEVDLTTKIIDVKSRLRSVEINGNSIDIAPLAKSTRPIRIEDVLPKGTSDNFRIVEYTPNQIRWRARDPLGGTFEFVAKRVPGRFVRS